MGTVLIRTVPIFGMKQKARLLLVERGDKITVNGGHRKPRNRLRRK